MDAIAVLTTVQHLTVQYCLLQAITQNVAALRSTTIAQCNMIQASNGRQMELRGNHNIVANAQPLLDSHTTHKRQHISHKCCWHRRMFWRRRRMLQSEVTIGQTTYITVPQIFDSIRRLRECLSCRADRMIFFRFNLMTQESAQNNNGRL